MDVPSSQSINPQPTDQTTTEMAEVQQVKKSRKPRRQSKGILTAPTGMGGLDSGGGHDFQTRYLVCELPRWLSNPDFTAIFHEGVGDIDVRYGRATPEQREHIQVKKHIVDLSEFLKVIGKFVDADSQMPGVYQRFTLACPNMTEELQPVYRIVNRIRNGKAFYDTNPQALDKDKSELEFRLNELKIPHGDFIEAKVHFHLELHNFNDDGSCREFFSGRIQSYPTYRDRLASSAAHAVYSELFSNARANIGRVVNRADYEEIIDKAALSNSPVGRSALHLVIHNWSVEKFEVSPDVSLDWSKHFRIGENPRVVPPPNTWKEDLLPQLHNTRAGLRIFPARLIRFFGKCCLSSGISLGQVFPHTDGWTFEILQPPKDEPWRSNLTADRSLRMMKIDHSAVPDVIVQPTSREVVVVVNVRRDSLKNVKEYLLGQGIAFSALYSLEPPEGKGADSIADAQEAVNVAMGVRRALDEIQDEHSNIRTHIFYNGPFALAVFIGQHLNAIGEVQLYEFLGPGSGFAPSALLTT